MRVCLGGTFDVLHAGHEALLGRAFEIGTHGVLIGISSDRMARRKRKTVRPLAARRQSLRAFLRRRGWRGYRISVLEDVAGPAAYEEDLDAIVVSEERVEAAGRINAERRRRGRKAMRVVTVPMVLAEDGLPISSRRIRAGKVTRSGRSRRPLEVRVGTTNPAKLDGVRRAFAAVFGKVRVRGVDVRSGVPKQPFGSEAIDGARARAHRALRGADFGVGVEAGLFWNDRLGEYLDVQYVAIEDQAGRTTFGHGPGFAYPGSVMAKVRKGRTVGAAMESATGVRGIGRREGAVGWLSRGAMDRASLTEAGVLMALIPRIRRDLYRRGVADRIARR